MEQRVVKKEIVINDDCLWNGVVKQEFIEDIDEKWNITHPSKQDWDRCQIDKKYMIPVKTENDNKHNKRNKSKCLNVIWKKITELLINGKCIKKITVAGIIICVYCGNLYTKRVEFLCHFLRNHCIKRNVLYKTEFIDKNPTKDETIDISILENDVKNEIEEVENELETELQKDDFETHADRGLELFSKVKSLLNVTFVQKLFQ
ncbi:uncharacterized protein LOC130895982 [Diorhabda carinulata]|uniref:uncharacterized protein LOC130895982 n=1 Tax=Diorhabda carinulata TaxID=1163345 RepID=UPI0025A0D90C|nr:uncharacterized protein LOC130895982 [Diorhabda carinulata]